MTVVLSIWVVGRVEDDNRQRALSSATREAEMIAHAVVSPHLPPSRGDATLGPNALNHVNAAYRTYLSGAPSYVKGVQVLIGQTAVFASGEGVSQPPSPSSDVKAALEGGTARSVRRTSDEPLLEVAVPLNASSPSSVIVRVMMSYDDLVAGTSTQAKALYLLLGDLALVLGTVLALLISFHRTSVSLRKQSAKNVHQALHDELTGLPNRTLFKDRAEQAITRARRDHRATAVMVMDLDRFKEINDTLGHHHGDLLLCEIGGRLLHLLREVDTISRFGGDEFAILLEDVAHIDAALDVATKIREAVSRPTALSDFDLSIDASIGIALFPSHADDYNTLLQRADVAMYSAKTKGTRCEVYAAEQDHYSPDRLALAHGLKGAIAAGELILHYQPQLSFETDQVARLEALVRWDHPTLGLLGPDKFISIAENAGLIKPLTHWVLDTALHQCRSWRDQGLELDVAVNISARNLTDSSLVDEVALLLNKYGVPPESLELEITETAIMADVHHAIETLTRLRALGVRIAIDDFGTGHSSLSYLQQLPVTTVKIDRTFVGGMCSSPSHLTIVRSTIDLGRSLGLQVIAEGVEDRETWDALRDLGCHLAQGYWRCKSVPADQVPWLMNVLEVPSFC